MASTTTREKVEEKDSSSHPQAVKMDVEHNSAVHHCCIVDTERDEGASDRSMAIVGRYDRCRTQMYVQSSI